MDYRFQGHAGVWSRASAYALIGASAIALTACGKKPDAKAEAPKERATQTVSVVPAKVEALPRVINASGTVSAWEEVPVGAETGGLTATAVLVDEGDYVRQGQVLVKLNDSVLSAQLRQQDAAVASARATLSEASAALNRARELNRSGYLSAASLETAVARQQTAVAQLASAEASRGETAARLAQTNVRAPVNGTISSRSVTKGQIVGAGSELFRMVRDGRLELDAQIPETELALVRAGMPAAVSSEQVGQATGRVRIVTPQVDAQSRLGTARIALTQPGDLKPGMFARAQIQAGAQPSIVVPTAAVLYRENRPGVYVVDPANRVRFRQVAVLTRTGSQTALTGLTAGERVAVDGAGFLGDGDLVRVGQAAAPAGLVRTSNGASQ
ncbi:efflux RND transporter periplasmic adaptor subunit [Phenylobacterium deserti]|uniref:efflux RND transporter periplasmic adaptor subunit n=1 Tax=Phenylobacterium deserti TaxID=1914756 RepID=UPI001F0BFA79|nr:efflux RND transporter periplasmic adaptor subunit [Phenylobacterium deserti]